MKTGFDEFTAKKTISKLKQDLKIAREDCKKHIVEKNKLKDVPSGIPLIDNALKLASNFQYTKKKLDNEIKSLSKKVNEKRQQRI